MSVPTPDIAGFVAAQQTLRDTLGRDVRFYGPADIIYDPSVPASAFDDEGFPLDPLIGGSATASANVEVPNLTVVGWARVNVLFQPLAAMRRDDVIEQPIGTRSTLNKDLILGIEDKAQAENATYFEIGTFQRDDAGNVIDASWVADDGELWHIANAKTDGFGGLQRYIVFGQGTH